MSFVYKHWEVNGEQIRRIETDPDSAVTPGDIAVLSFLTLPDDKRGYALGRFTIGRFEQLDGEHTDCLHTGSLTTGDFQEVARGVVVDDMANPDGLYEIYVPV